MPPPRRPPSEGPWRGSRRPGPEPAAGWPRGLLLRVALLRIPALLGIALLRGVARLLRLTAPGTARPLLLRGVSPAAAPADATNPRRRCSTGTAAAPEDWGRGGLPLGLFELLVEALDRLFLHVDQLRHRVGRVGLGPELVGDEPLGIGVAGLAACLLQTLEDTGDDIAFLAVHQNLLQSNARPAAAPSCSGRTWNAVTLCQGRIAKSSCVPTLKTKKPGLSAGLAKVTMGRSGAVSRLSRCRTCSSRRRGRRRTRCRGGCWPGRKPAPRPGRRW